MNSNRPVFLVLPIFTIKFFCFNSTSIASSNNLYSSFVLVSFIEYLSYIRLSNIILPCSSVVFTTAVVLPDFLPLSSNSIPCSFSPVFSSVLFIIIPVLILVSLYTIFTVSSLFASFSSTDFTVSSVK